MAVIWHRSEQAEPLARNALEGLLSECSNKPALLLLSGGSWLSIYDRVAVSQTAIYSTLTLMMGDERVTYDPEVNNAAQFMETKMYQTMQAKGAHFIDTRVRENETPVSHAQRLEQEVRAWQEANPYGSVYATLGIGDDGHIAGIMPRDARVGATEELFDGESWFVGYETTRQGEQKYRSTITFCGLRALIARALVHASGTQKHAVLKALYNQKGEINELPSLILYDLPMVDIYTDLS